jgi:hypothetical protein
VVFLPDRKDGPLWELKNRPATSREWSLENILKASLVIIDSCYTLTFQECRKQVIGLPMGVEPAPPMANLCFYHYEKRFVDDLVRRIGTEEVIRRYHGFRFNGRFIDDCISPVYDSNGTLTEADYGGCQYSETGRGAQVIFLGIQLTISNPGSVQFKARDKQHAFDFTVVRFPSWHTCVSPQVRVGTVTGMLVRTLRFTTLTPDMIQEMQFLIGLFKQRGYVLKEVKLGVMKFLQGHIKPQFHERFRASLQSALDNWENPRSFRIRLPPPNEPAAPHPPVLAETQTDVPHLASFQTVTDSHSQYEGSSRDATTQVVASHDGASTPSAPLNAEASASQDLSEGRPNSSPSDASAPSESQPSQSAADLTDSRAAPSQVPPEPEAAERQEPAQAPSESTVQESEPLPTATPEATAEAPTTSSPTVNAAESQPSSSNERRSTRINLADLRTRAALSSPRREVAPSDSVPTSVEPASGLSLPSEALSTAQEQPPQQQVIHHHHHYYAAPQPAPTVINNNYVNMGAVNYGDVNYGTLQQLQSVNMGTLNYGAVNYGLVQQSQSNNYGLLQQCQSNNFGVLNQVQNVNEGVVNQVGSLSQNYLENHQVVNNTLQLDLQLQHQEYNLHQLEYTTNNFNTVALFGAVPHVPEAVLGGPLPLDVDIEVSEEEVPLRLVAGNELQTVAEPAPASLVLATDALVEPALRSEHSPTSDRNFIVTGITEVVDEALSLPAPDEVSAAGPALPAPSAVLAIQERPSSSLNQSAPSGSRPPSPTDGPSRKASKRCRDDGVNANDPEQADQDWLRRILQQSVPRSISQVLLGHGANDTSQSGDPDEWALVPHPSAE